MRLRQGQVWKQNEHYIRIVSLDKLAVAYKILNDLQTKHGTHHTITKKEFCRLVKKAILLSPAPTQPQRG
jgi:hypothetical protein